MTTKSDVRADSVTEPRNWTDEATGEAYTRKYTFKSDLLIINADSAD